MTASAPPTEHPEMSVFDTPAAMRSWSDDQRRDRRTVGFVPTMGALHAGHGRLIEVAAECCDVVVVSVFVNPLQFDRRDDFDRYPRPIRTDLERCREIGVHAVYAPTPAAVYPEGFDTHVEPGRLAEELEGRHRPGHFRGVATVVTKLFAAVRPHVAVFGEKDAQQLAVVRRLSADLDLGVEIVGVPTVREPDGLALSSRNERLDPVSRDAARCIPRALDVARALVAGGETAADVVRDGVRRRLGDEPTAEVEYVAVVDRRTFEPIDRIDEHALVVVAVWVGGVRLIDNLRLVRSEGG